MTSPIFAPASRRATKLKLAIEGPSGSGKTLGALALAHGLAAGDRVAVIDTENGSASLYADRFPFDTLELRPPYLTSKYQDAVQAAIDGGYAVVVIDSLSHQWEGEGSVLQRKEQADARGGNHFSNWAPFSKEHNEFRALILNAPLHLIGTMRSKMAYAQEGGGDGKKTTIKKLGLQPIQREGMEYEFTIAFDVQMDHRALASKDRTGLFATELVDLIDPRVSERLLSWLKTAKPLEVPPAPTAETPWPREGKMQGKLLKEWPEAALLKLCEPGINVGPHTAAWRAIAEQELARRAQRPAAGVAS